MILRQETISALDYIFKMCCTMKISFGIFLELFCVILLTDCVRISANRFTALSSIPEWKTAQEEPGCLLGGEHYRLKEKFSPSIEPYGKMSCLICQCIPVMKKGIIQHYGKVKCVKIEDECPIPKCNKPRLHPGRCCKSCPGEAIAFEDSYSLLPEDVPPEVDKALRGDDDLINKYKLKAYIALLVGKNVRSRVPVYTRAVALVNLKVTSSGSLQFTVRHTSLDRPRSIQLLDGNGNVLLEKRLEIHGQDSKYCGEWTKVPFYYLRYLHKNKLLITITTFSYPGGEIAGKPEIDKTQAHETFGALLVAPNLEGTGAYAALTYGVRSRKLSYSIRHDGLFQSRRTRQEYFVTIEKRTKILHQKAKRVHRKSKVKGLWKNASKKSRQLLVKGRLRLRITSKGGTTMIGYISAAFKCGTFQAPLASGEALVNTGIPQAGAGSAVFKVEDAGNIAYKIRLFNMQNLVTSITLEGPPTLRGNRRIVRDLTKSYKRNATSFNGVATGRLQKLRVKDIVMLQTGKLFVNVATISSRESVIRGRITQIDAINHIDMYKDPPYMLMSPLSSPTGAAGHAWITVGNDCILYYQLVLSGLRGHGDDLTALITGDYDTRNSASSNAIYTIIITDFIHGMARGKVSDMSEAVFLSLDRGTSFLHVEVKGVHKGELRANLTIPNNCWQMANDHIPDVFVDEHGNPILRRKHEHSCVQAGKVYLDGHSWHQNNSKCITCTCKRGDIQCHQVVCPELACAVQKTIPQECCPVCAENDQTHMTPEVSEDGGINARNDSCFYGGDKRWHPVGSQWYPYVPPFGYVTCTICTCEAVTRTINCTKKACPPLDCPASHAVRIQETDCCQVCPETTTSLTSDVSTSEPVPLSDINPEGACVFGEKVFVNNQKWSPVIPPFGKMKCFVCQCIGGSIKCRMKARCRKNACRGASCRSKGNKSKQKGNRRRQHRRRQRLRRPPLSAPRKK